MVDPDTRETYAAPSELATFAARLALGGPVQVPVNARSWQLNAAFELAEAIRQGTFGSAELRRPVMW